MQERGLVSESPPARAIYVLSRCPAIRVSRLSNAANVPMEHREMDHRSTNLKSESILVKLEKILVTWVPARPLNSFATWVCRGGLPIPPPLFRSFPSTENIKSPAWGGCGVRGLVYSGERASLQHIRTCNRPHISAGDPGLRAVIIMAPSGSVVKLIPMVPSGGREASMEWMGDEGRRRGRGDSPNDIEREVRRCRCSCCWAGLRSLLCEVARTTGD